VSTKRNVYRQLLYNTKEDTGKSLKNTFHTAVCHKAPLGLKRRWTVKKNQAMVQKLGQQRLRNLTTFQLLCPCYLGVSRYQQWRKHIDTKKLLKAYNMQWLFYGEMLFDHLGHMGGDRLPKQLLFGELQRRRPFSWNQNTVAWWVVVQSQGY